jgi:MmyB-like transcription regulator ligand binding domain
VRGASSWTRRTRACGSPACRGRRACAAKRSRPSPESAPTTTCGSSRAATAPVGAGAGEPFRRLWARHDVKALAGAPTRIRHPEVGTLELRREKLTIGETDGQLLVIYHAEPGSDSARSLALLGSLAVTDAGSEVSDPSRS